MVVLDRGKVKCRRYPSPALSLFQCGCLSLKTKMNKIKYYDFIYSIQHKVSTKIFKKRKRLRGKNAVQDMVDRKMPFHILCITVESVFRE